MYFFFKHDISTVFMWLYEKQKNNLLKKIYQVFTIKNKNRYFILISYSWVIFLKNLHINSYIIIHKITIK
jgi:hypothetical protein